MLIYPRAVLICAWAEKGADALGPDGVIVHSDAFPPESLVDTLGAGDTFNAGVIYTLSNGEVFKNQCWYELSKISQLSSRIKLIFFPVGDILVKNTGSDVY